MTKNELIEKLTKEVPPFTTMSRHEVETLTDTVMDFMDMEGRIAKIISLLENLETSCSFCPERFNDMLLELSEQCRDLGLNRFGEALLQRRGPITGSEPMNFEGAAGEDYILSDHPRVIKILRANLLGRRNAAIEEIPFEVLHGPEDFD